MADYQAFTGKALQDFVKNSGIHVIGWRPFRELMRRKAGRGLRKGRMGVHVGGGPRRSFRCICPDR